jgi:hypothetical protein
MERRIKRRGLKKQRGQVSPSKKNKFESCQAGWGIGV